MEQREDNIFLWCDFFKEEIIIKIRMLDFLVFQTLSTVPRKQRCSFIECHLTVFLEGIALCSPPPGCSSFSGITRMSVNIWVTWFLLGKPCLTLRENQSANQISFSLPLCLSLSFYILLHLTPIPTGAHQPSPNTPFYFLSPPSFIWVTVTVFQLVSWYLHFHFSNSVFIQQPECSFCSATLITFFHA